MKDNRSKLTPPSLRRSAGFAVRPKDICSTYVARLPCLRNFVLTSRSLIPPQSRVNCTEVQSRYRVLTLDSFTSTWSDGRHSAVPSEMLSSIRDFGAKPQSYHSRMATRK